MTRGETQQTKVHFKGMNDEFVVFVNNTQAAEEWILDKSIPLVQVVKVFKIYKTRE